MTSSAALLNSSLKREIGEEGGRDEKNMIMTNLIYFKYLERTAGLHKTYNGTKFSWEFHVLYMKYVRGISL